ncbi:PAS domain-containing protein [Ahrensia sp. R2A130]|uniref:PAS domain-containing protein n=1 Tax=Ahrensia sp. R2A130 TaxID=744979 RepID=UPI0001E0D888|nr:PAS domain-containing protein [Ahrensia sp. R2A130]EFL87925.1 PAS fold-3 domain protein [Ahrensia sp. R2A130]
MQSVADVEFGMESINDILNLDFRERARNPQMIDDIDVSGAELLNILSAFDNYGMWRLDIETSQVSWSEDVFRIHELPQVDGPVDLEAAISRYHPEDQQYLPQVIEEAITRKSAFRFVLRLKRAYSGYKLVKSTGKFRHRPGCAPEMIGTFSEFQPANRAIASIG